MVCFAWVLVAVQGERFSGGRSFSGLYLLLKIAQLLKIALAFALVEVKQRANASHSLALVGAGLTAVPFLARHSLVKGDVNADIFLNFIFSPFFLFWW